MTGAIIGDLAAWTWEKENDRFYPHLISDNAELSEYGGAILAAYELLFQSAHHAPWQEIHSVLKDFFVSIHPTKSNIQEVSDFIKNGQRVIPQSIKSILVIAVTCVAGWKENPRQTALKWTERFHGGKEAYYFTQIAEVIYKLRHGATKSDAIKDTAYIIDWNTHKEENGYISPLFYACLAWKCFNESWDYTSAIHNAARTQCKYPRLLAVITGALAESMYGCEMMILKKKYQQNDPFSPLTIPQEIYGKFGRVFSKLNKLETECRVFFPKNSALTNVERHHFIEVVNPFSCIHFTARQYTAILEAFYTGWECRYGFYLDNGWIYVYRSFVLIGRFKLYRQDNECRIAELQMSGERPFGDLCVAICSALNDGCLIHDHQLNNIARTALLLKYYDGYPLPKEMVDTPKAKFWHGEMMFISQNINLDEWASEAKNTRKKLPEDKKIKVAELSDESLGILIYIEALFGKFCPYDDFKWIFEY